MNSQTYDFSAINDRISLANEGRVTGSFRDYAITSAFQPIFSLSHSDPVGYEARCRARSADGLAVSPFVLFGQVQSEADNVLLDRLCRAAHVQNFSACSDKKSWIFLNVNPLITVLGKNFMSGQFTNLVYHNWGRGIECPIFTVGTPT